MLHLLVESVGVPYPQLMLVALIPALLYFAGIWIMVDFEARHKGLKGLPREKLPPTKPLLLQKGHLVLFEPFRGLFSYATHDKKLYAAQSSPVKIGRAHV